MVSTKATWRNARPIGETIVFVDITGPTKSDVDEIFEHLDKYFIEKGLSYARR